MTHATIGKAAARVGLKAPTVRYYEQIGLLHAPRRTDSDRRLYDQVAIDRLTFIKQARDLGFSIEAIRTLLDLADHPDQPCAGVNAIVQQELDTVDRKIAQLRRLREELSRLGSTCSTGGRISECHVIESLSHHTASAS